MIVLVDTGVLLRLADPADPQHPIVVQEVQSIRNRGDALVIAGQNAAEFWNVCTRPASARGGWGLAIQEADRRLKAVEAAFPLLPEATSVYGIWRGLISTHAVVGKQVHDARLTAIMMAHGVTHILTLNAGDFARFPGIVEIVPSTLAAPPTSAP